MTYDPIRQFKGYLDFAGKVGLFAVRAARRAVVPPFEGVMIWRGIEEVGWKSLPLVLASGFALGVVLTLHTRSSLVRFGAEAMIPTFQAVAFFNEIGPLVVGLLVAGCVGAGIGASLADMRVTEQIDAIEAFSIDSFKLFVVPRIIACVVSLPILTVFIDGNHSQGRSEFTDKLLEAAKTRSPLSLIEHLETVRFHFRGYSGSPVSAFNADRITCFARVMLLIIVVVVFPFFAITCTTRLS